MSSSASFQASQLFAAAGLAGAIVPVVVRSSFGPNLWTSVISLDTGISTQVVSPLRAFNSSAFPLRFRDIAVTLGDSSIDNMAGLLVFLAVSDLPVLVNVILEGVEDSAGGAGFLVRAHAPPKAPHSICIGSQDHYARLGLSRFPQQSGLNNLVNNDSVVRQLGEQLFRLGKLLAPQASLPQVVRELVMASLLITGLTSNAKMAGGLPGRRTAALPSRKASQRLGASLAFSRLSG